MSFITLKQCINSDLIIQLIMIVLLSRIIYCCQLRKAIKNVRANIMGTNCWEIMNLKMSD